MDKTEKLLSAIQNVAKKLREVKAREIKDSEFQDLSLSSFKYLEEIHNLGNPTFIELTKRLSLSKPTVTAMVAKLIEKELVQKTRYAGDKRVYRISLAPKGEELMEGYNKAYKQFIDQTALKFNDEEMDTLIALLRRM